MQMYKRVTVIIVLLMLVFSVVPVSAAQSDEARILGIVPVKGSVSAEAGGQLQYHNGPVMLTNKVYAIYWVPAGYSVSGSYTSNIDTYFQDVAVDNGKTSNVYFSDTQYYQTLGGITKYIKYDTTFGGSYLDTNPYPASGCALYGPVTKCLTDGQLRKEINRVKTLMGWKANSTTEFFIFTAQNVGSCVQGYCAFTYFCAYHSWAKGNLLYANQPYTGTSLPACGVTFTPNGDFDSDSTINVVSHEHNEAITDPKGTGWWDKTGYENGDKCAWNFGSGVNSGHQYNQTINGHNYLLQKEWSNKSKKCVLTNK